MIFFAAMTIGLVGCTATPAIDPVETSSAPPSSVAPSTLFDNAPTGADLDKTLRNGFGDYNASSFGKLLASADDSTPKSQDFSAEVSANGTLFVVFTCEGSGSVDITVRNGNEDVMHVWNEQCAPDIAYGGESAPFKTASNQLTMVIEATPGVRYAAVIEGAPPAPID